MATRTRSAVVLVAVALLLSLPCSEGCRPSPSIKVRMAIYPGELSTPVAVAEEKGYFSSSGLDVSISSYESGVPAIAALLAGEADVATASDYAFASTAFFSSDLRLLAAIDWASTMWFVTSNDRGISSTEELRGRAVGVPPGTSAEYAMGRSLNREGMTTEDVSVVYFGPGELGQALASRRVDAVVIWDPIAYEIGTSLGSEAVKWHAQGNRHYHWMLISKASVLEKEPEMSERLLKSVVEAERFILERPEEAKQIVSKRYDIDRKYIDYVWPLNRFDVVLSQCLMFELDMQARWFENSGLAGGVEAPNYIEFVDFAGLEKADPDAVRVAH